MTYTKEFYEVMEFFEGKVLTEQYGSRYKAQREARDLWTKRIYYTDGAVNEAFKMFLQGYAHGKAIWSQP
jgi:hypothetical protein